MTPELKAKLAMIRAECEWNIDVGARASGGPWILSAAGYYLMTTDGYEVASCKGATRNMDFIAHARTFSPAAARAVLGMIDALSGIVGREPSKSHACEAAEEALQSLADQWPAL